ncbi:MAG: hypothetical protein EB157_03730 [Euryarchaeota archaeon]|nr:hypothetical protein [Euryarchaeota archaeon]
MTKTMDLATLLSNSLSNLGRADAWMEDICIATTNHLVLWKHLREMEQCSYKIFPPMGGN